VAPKPPVNLVKGKMRSIIVYDFVKMGPGVRARHRGYCAWAFMEFFAGGGHGGAGRFAFRTWQLHIFSQTISTNKEGQDLPAPINKLGKRRTENCGRWARSRRRTCRARRIVWGVISLARICTFWAGAGAGLEGGERSGHISWAVSGKLMKGTLAPAGRGPKNHSCGGKNVLRAKLTSHGGQKDFREHLPERCNSSGLTRVRGACHRRRAIRAQSRPRLFIVQFAGDIAIPDQLCRASL